MRVNLQVDDAVEAPHLASGPEVIPVTGTLRRNLISALAATTTVVAMSALPAHAADSSRLAPRTAMGAAVAQGLSGTLVYIAGNNVWIARPDGSGARRLTSNGTANYPYVSPSEDDAGHIVVGHLTDDPHSSVKDAKLVRMDQSGNVLQTFDTPVRSLNILFARVSPDGSKVAYGALFGSSDCSDYADCYTFFDHTLHYSSATRSAVPSGGGGAEGVNWATWAGNGRTILEMDTDHDIGYQSPTQKQATTWFHTCNNYDSGCNDTDIVHHQPTVDRAGDRYAASVHALPWNTDPEHPNGTEYLFVGPTVNATTATPPAAPGAGCLFQGTDATTPFPGDGQLTISGPSFSPDGQEVAVQWRAADGTRSVAVAVVPDLADCTSAGVYEVIPGGSQPFWGSAPLSAYHHIASRLSWTGGRIAVHGKHRVGRKLYVSRRLARSFRPHATSITYRWLRNGHKIRGAHHRTYRVHRRDRHKRLSVVVTGHRGGYRARSVTSKRVRIR